LRHFCQTNDKPLLDLTADAMNTLIAYDWPGNVRELRTAIEHGVVMATEAKVTLRDLPAAVRKAAPVPGTRVRSFDETASPLDLHATEKRLIGQALAATKGNITAAAKKLGISRRTLHRKINEMKSAEEDGGIDKIRRTAASQAPGETELANPQSEGIPNDQTAKFKTDA
jgi:two-component system response regulator AtoC